MSQVSLHDSSKICESVGGESKLSTNPIKTRFVKRTSSNGKKIHRVLTPIPTKSKQFDKLFIDTSTKKHQTIARTRSNDKVVERVLTPKPPEMLPSVRFLPFFHAANEIYDNHTAILEDEKEEFLYE